MAALFEPNQLRMRYTIAGTEVRLLPLTDDGFIKPRTLTLRGGALLVPTLLGHSADAPTAVFRYTRVTD